MLSLNNELTFMPIGTVKSTFMPIGTVKSTFMPIGTVKSTETRFHENLSIDLMGNKLIETRPIRKLTPVY